MRRSGARSIRPALGRSSPISARTSVDLPAPLGPMMVTISPGSTVRLLRRDEPGYCWIGVHNTGPTIDPQHLNKLFDRFYRIDPSRAEPGDSGGLGLAIVRSIMHLHDGQVRVSSDDSGTLFELGFARA